MTAQTLLEEILILGVGTPLMGDDVVGLLVIQQLQERDDLPPTVTVVDGGTEGLGLIPLLEAYQRVIIVDAAMMGLPAGTVRRFTWEDVRAVQQNTPLSLHQSDLTETLLLAEVLNCLPPNTVIFGVQPQHIDWDQPVSEAVLEAIPAVVEALLREIRS